MASLVGVDAVARGAAARSRTPGSRARPATDRDVRVEALIDQLADAIEDCLPADAVGIGMPSVVDFATGRARSSVNIPLEDVPLRKMLRERLGIPVYVDNDATVAAVAEAHGADAQVDVRHLVMLTVGTGVGGGIVVDGRVYRGATGAAAELGHMIIGADLERRRARAARRRRSRARSSGSPPGRALDGWRRPRLRDGPVRRGREARRCARCCARACAIARWARWGSASRTRRRAVPDARRRRRSAAACSAAGELLRPAARGDRPSASSCVASARRPRSAVPRYGPSRRAGAALMAGQECAEHEPRR